MHVTYSERGFKHLDPITTTRRETVRVYESSAAETPHVWLNVTVDPHGAYDSLTAGKGHAHLSLDQVRELRDQLNFMLANHYLT